MVECDGGDNPWEGSEREGRSEVYRSPDEDVSRPQASPLRCLYVAKLTPDQDLRPVAKTIPPTPGNMDFDAIHTRLLAFSLYQESRLGQGPSHIHASGTLYLTRPYCIV
jgi:hypothetical protein